MKPSKTDEANINGPRASVQVEPLHARYVVPRDREHVPDLLARKYVEYHGAGKRKKLRQLYRREQLRLMDACLSVDAAAAGALFGLSERAWRRLDATGEIPPPIKVGRNVRWRLKELAAWVRAGCPDRETWAARTESAT